MSKKVCIVYASLTGNTEEAAKFVAMCFQSMDADVQVFECTQVNANVFLEADLCIVATYTYGANGDLPDEIVAFYEELGVIDLKGKYFATLGTGEEDYGYFCKSAEDFSSQFEKTGAIKLGKTFKIEERPDIETKKKLATWTKEIWKEL